MMSLEEMRKALKRPDLSDERIAAIRATLYTLAEMLIDDYLAERDGRSRKQQ